MRITLNLATRPFADLGPAIKRLGIAMAALAVLAIAMLLGLRALDQKAKRARARDHSLDGQIALATQERQSYHDLMRQPPNAHLLEQAGVLNRLFDEKAFSWTLTMEDLETVLPGGVQVTTLEPVRAKDGHITLHLRVVGPRDRAVELVQNLEHSKRFLLPRIVGENAEASEGPAQKLEPVSASNRVDFDVLAEYKPALPGERIQAKKAAAPDAGSKAALSVARRGTHPLPDPGFKPAQHPGRPPYTGSPQPAVRRPNPALLPNPASGGPR